MYFKKFITAILIFVSSSVYAQTKEQLTIFQNNLNLLTNAINNKDVSAIEALCVSDYKVSGYESPMANKILSAIIEQVSNYPKLSINAIQSSDNNFLITSEDKDGDPVTVLVTADGQFIELNLVQVQVQETNSIAEAKALKPIPFEMNRELVAIDVEVNGVTGKFILDTGASMPVLDSTFAAELGVKPVHNTSVNGAGGSSMQGVSNTVLFKVGGAEVSNSAVLVDLSHLDGSYSIDGIIGADLFKHFVVEIDYDRQLLSLHESVDAVEVVGEPYDITFKMGQIPALNIAFTTKKKLYTDEFLIDTGASLNLAFNKSYSDKINLLDEVGIGLISSYASLSRTENTNHEVVINNISLADFDFAEVPTLVSGRDIAGKSGIIGNGLFRRFNQVFDYKNSKMYLIRNKSFGSSFLYPCAGFKLSKRDGKLFAKHVLEESPAQKMGIYEGAQILSVNNMSVESYEAARLALHQDGQTVRVVFMTHDGDTKAIELPLNRLI